MKNFLKSSALQNLLTATYGLVLGGGAILLLSSCNERNQYDSINSNSLLSPINVNAITNASSATSTGTSGSGSASNNTASGIATGTSSAAQAAAANSISGLNDFTLSQRTSWEISHTISVSQVGTNVFNKFIIFMFVPKDPTVYQDSYSFAASSELSNGVKALEINISPFAMTAWTFEGLGKLTGDSGQSGNSVGRNIVYYTSTSSVLVDPSVMNLLLLSDYTKTEEEDLYLTHFNGYFDKENPPVQDAKQKILQLLSSSASQDKRSEVVINLVTEAFKLFVGAGIKISDRSFPSAPCNSQPGNDSQVLEGNCGTQIEVASSFCSLLASLGVPCRPVLGFYASGISAVGQGAALRAWVEVKFPKHPWLPINIVEAILNSSSVLDKTYFLNLPFDFVGVVRGLYWDEFNSADSLSTIATGGSVISTTGFVPKTQRFVSIKKIDANMTSGSPVRAN